MVEVSGGGGWRCVLAVADDAEERLTVTRLQGETVVARHQGDARSHAIFIFKGDRTPVTAVEIARVSSIADCGVIARFDVETRIAGLVRDEAAAVVSIIAARC